MKASESSGGRSPGGRTLAERAVGTDGHLVGGAQSLHARGTQHRSADVQGARSRSGSPRREREEKSGKVSPALSREEIAALVDAIGDTAVACLAARDAEGFVDYAEGFRDEDGRPQQLRLMDRYVSLLRDFDMFEKALLHAYQCNSVNNHSNYDYDALSRLLEAADPEKLRAAGQPAPGPGPFTLYRGVAGRGRARHVQGFSWTGSLGVAGSQAEILGLPDPAVFRAVVPRSCVLAYVLGEEDEYLVRLPTSARPKRVPESEWRPALERHNSRAGRV